MLTSAIYVSRDNATSLNEHIVARSRYRARPDGIGVSRVPADLDRVRVGVGKQQRRDGPHDPAIGIGGVGDIEEDLEGNEPYLSNHGDQCQFAEDFGSVC